MPNVKLLAAKLAREYFDVITAYNGVQALELVRRESPDIVLLDVMMPGMDGFEVCQRIRSDPLTMHIPIVMVTALSDVADRVRGLEAGADDFLTKPVNDIALFARVRSLVRLKMIMDEWRLRETTSGQFGVLSSSISVQNESVQSARVLVLEPTRELAAQVETSFRNFARFTDLRAVAIFGGVGYGAQRQELARGVDILVIRELTGGIYFGKPSERRDGPKGR